MAEQITERIDADGVGTTDEWTLGAGASKAAAVASNDGDTSYIHDNSASARTQLFDIDTSGPTTFAYISAIRVYARVKWVSDSSTIPAVVIGINGSTSTTALSDAGASDYELLSGTMTRPGGGDWTDADLRLTGANRFQFGIQIGSDAQDMRCTECYVEVDGIPLARSIDLERETISRYLLSNKNPRDTVTIVGALDHYEAELGDRVGCSHADAPTPDGAGWGVQDWRRGYTRLVEQQIELLGGLVHSSLRNRRLYLASYYETCKLTRSGDPDKGDGFARLDASGAAREFARSSNAWSVDIGGQVKLRTPAKEKFETAGLLCESPRTNLQTRSSFVSGLTGWSKNEDTGTGTFAADTGDLLFESSVSTQSGRLTLDTALAEVDLLPPAITLATSTEYTFSLDYKTEGSSAIGIKIQNTSTGNWLQANGTWTAIENDQVLNAATSPSRYALTFTSEASGTAYQVTIKCTNVSAGERVWVYHTQVEAGAWASSRIVTDASTYERLGDDLRIRNDSTLSQRIFPVDKFTAEILFTPQWNSGDVDARQVLWELYHDANNQIRLQHPASSSQLELVYEHAGTVEGAVVSASLVAGTEYRITCRKTGASGELDLTAGTISIFLDGVKGATEDVAASDLTQAASSYLQIGALNDGTSQCNGHIGSIFVSPVVYSDAEIEGGIT